MDQAGRRVVITGIGVISPVGNTLEAMWSGVTSGTSGVRRITRFDADGFETTFAGEVDGFDPGATLGRKEARRMDRYAQFAVASALQAAEHAGLGNGSFVAERAGVFVG